MQKLIVTILGIIFVNSLFTLLPSINASIGGGILVVYQFYFNSLFLLSFLLQKRISFPKSETIVQAHPVINGIIKIDDKTVSASTQEKPIYKAEDSEKS